MKALQVRSKIWLEVDGAPPTGAFLSESLGATDSRCWPHRLLRAIERHGSINAAASTRRFSGVDWNGMAAAISNIKMAALIGM